MLSRILRTSGARRTAFALRYVASKATNNIKPPSHTLPSASTLPPAKMRALISLYHNADRFITPATLSQSIDEAFIKKVDQYYSSNEISRSELEYDLKDRRALPRIGEGKEQLANKQIATDQRNIWSGQESVRENEVRSALFGMTGRGRPGWEVLEEEHERIQQHIRTDREAKEAAAQEA
ncbi:hypothetical protein PHLGIDRAFT_113433 [Phlebiopsis gigantea 11061_1 CR5-6]|uniref:Uncharacterized protein n=1 Tax=Phlebiopsis gigantea (strain 11061_1 CR5-6) TaxID=745531 RepID=A0A0C3SFX5_PHLG1|nr:hypothetical protein PHLGIDRAFT_113433 [Phlebiopsis gigantea 11061_1 CR5-6]